MAMNSEFDRQVTFEITEQIGVIATYPTGWRKELNLVSWNGGNPKYDIRDWDPDHEHMSRGVTLHEKEMRLIIDLLRKRRQQNHHRGESRSEAGKEAAESEAVAADGERDASCDGEFSFQEDPEAAEVMRAIAEEKA